MFALDSRRIDSQRMRKSSTGATRFRETSRKISLVVLSLAPVSRLRVRYWGQSCRTSDGAPRRLMTRNGHFGCQFAVWFGAVSDGLVRRHAIVIANLMFSFMLF
jgi:hypothetical protein